MVGRYLSELPRLLPSRNMCGFVVLVFFLLSIPLFIFESPSVLIHVPLFPFGSTFKFTGGLLLRPVPVGTHAFPRGAADQRLPGRASQHAHVTRRHLQVPKDWQFNHGLCPCHVYYLVGEGVSRVCHDGDLYASRLESTCCADPTWCYAAPYLGTLATLICTICNATKLE